jgi:hypothetical protein
MSGACSKPRQPSPKHPKANGQDSPPLAPSTPGSILEAPIDNPPLAGGEPSSPVTTEPPSPGPTSTKNQGSPGGSGEGAPNKSGGSKGDSGKELPVEETKTSPTKEPPTEETKTSPTKEPPTEETKTSPTEQPPTEETKTSPTEQPPTEETKTSPTEQPPTEETKTSPTKEPPTEETKGPPGPSGAQAEDFAGQPSDVLLTYGASVVPSDASRCVGLESSGMTVSFGNIDQGTTADTIRLELVPGGSMPAQVRCPAGNGTTVLTVSPAAPSSGGVTSDPIDPRYLTDVPFGDTSFWIQPWRAYLDTWPASRLLDSLGINFNVSPTESEGTAHLLQDSGFKLARIEIPWGSVSYSNPTKFVNETQVHTQLNALHKRGLRPLIVLNANSGGPGPFKEITLTTVESAAAGARTVTLSPTSTATVVAGKTGFDDLSFGGDPDILITSVTSEGVATLSKPLPAALAAGAHRGMTLLYAPFGPPELSSGAPNPAFQATLTGWLSYVTTVCREAEAIFGAGGYDLEVWNELSFGSQFLNQENYYSPSRETGLGSVTETLLAETVAYVRNPEHGISSQVGITDGFSSETPFASGATVPRGLTALSKHLYAGPQYFPAAETASAIKPINALGAPDYTTGGTKSNPLYTPLFTPNFASALPEYFLTATQTETEIRDLSPTTTSIYGVPHGRNAGPSGGEPPQTWMTEYNLNTNTLLPLNPEHPTNYYHTEISPAQAGRLQAEIALRSLVSMISKGMTREYFYAAAHTEGYSLISENFISALDAHPSEYPGDTSGGDTMNSFRNMLADFQGPGPEGAPRQLQLLSIAQAGNHAQFAGDGTSAHPSLYDREVLAVFPFQSSPTRFVIPVYVMTQNLSTVYNTSAPETDLTRFDLPDETFRITLGNLPETADPPKVSAYDPIRNESTSARFVSRQGDRAVFEFAATDYPRLLTVEYG